MKKTIIIALIAAAVVGAGAFYGGLEYSQSKNPRGMAQGNFSNFNSGQQGVNRSGNGLRSGSGFVSGEIISKDDKSITVKLTNGGSKIVFYSDTTEIGKFVSGAKNDLVVGETVMANGQANQDGSTTAQSIQIRPTPAPTNQ